MATQAADTTSPGPLLLLQMLPYLHLQPHQDGVGVQRRHAAVAAAWAVLHAAAARAAGDLPGVQVRLLL
jgi:hypothetical protein